MSTPAPITGYDVAGANAAIAAATAAKADLINGKVPTAQMPPASLTSNTTVTNAAARKALTSAQVQPGDIVTQTSPAAVFMLIDVNPAQDASWQVLPLGPGVSSVNGQTGAVVLGYADVGADQAGAASTALTSAQAYTDTKIAAEVTRANGAYSKITDNGNGTFTVT